MTTNVEEVQVEAHKLPEVMEAKEKIQGTSGF